MTLTRLPLARILRTRRAWLTIVLWACFSIVAAVFARQRMIVHGADHALQGGYASIGLPLLVYGLVAAVLGGEGLGRSGNPLVALGASPWQVARATVLVALGASAIAGALLAAAVAAVAHGSSDPPLLADLASSFEVGAVGGAAYAAFFALGASFGARGFGRSVLLVLDWVFGVGRDSSSILTPRAHLRSLLGGVAPLDYSPRASFIALAVLIVVCSAWATRRAARAEWRLAKT